jgi:hypothetical protein
MAELVISRSVAYLENDKWPSGAQTPWAVAPALEVPMHLEAYADAV